MSITKGNLMVDGNTVRMSMPFAKVDKEQRLVSGYATLDNVDTQDDIVTAEASAKAFARARGNIREMHQPLAVGKMVDFREDEFYDKDSKTFYRGIFVTARVSKGAQDTWEKVLDGTLAGFSIGGNINKASNEFNKDAGKSVRIIEDYDLVELSLVDNPANQLANISGFTKNIFSINTDANGSVTAKGMAVETKIENVFVCSKHDEDVVTVRETETEDCPLCGLLMENAGWFESGTDRTEKVQSIVEKFLNPSEMEAAPNSPSEGGVEMGVEKNKTEEKVEVVEPVVETEESEEIAGTEETEEEVTEEVSETQEEETAETPEEVTDEGTEISKKIDELHDAVKESLEKTRSETAETIAALEEKVDEATKQFLTKASELDEKLSGIGENLTTAKQRLAELESALEKVNAGDAIRKSADLTDEPAEQIVQKDASWNGAFSGKRATRFSVDNLM